MLTGRRCQTYADRLESFGDRVALVCDGGEVLSYVDLAARADDFADRLGPTRRLIAIEAENEAPALIALLGALRRGHPVLLLSGRESGNNQSILNTYTPDVCFRKVDGEWKVAIADEPAKLLHPDLALLLSTSGSTGAAKLVRLSHTAVEANANSIADYLDIGEDEAAITSLPIHYSYGLSVIGSHLGRGARLLLTDRSVTEQEFWEFCRAQAATSLAGVPYTYELFERVGFREMELPALRTLTQAGGRLDPGLAATYAAWSRPRGIRFFVMYGQTEATARMAYVPPERLAANPGTIGVPIPGGAFRLIDEAGTEVHGPDITGELVYSGANVMMGYATGPEDLARGQELEELLTGDLATCNAEGLYRIVGRKSRFSKLFGLRISYDEVEQALAAQGYVAHATGDDELVAVASAALPASSGEALAKSYGLPSRCFVSLPIEPPRLPSGKIDYPAILVLARQVRAANTSLDEAGVAAAFRQAFPQAKLNAGDSFISLGGDSLNYVSLSLAIESNLGFLPPDWDEKSIGDLAAMEPRRKSHKSFWHMSLIDSEVLIRCLAILAVVIAHARTALVVGGGAETLLVLVGYNMARYQRQALASGKGGQVLLRMLKRIILPYYLFLVADLLLKQRFDLPSLLLVSNFVGRFGSLLEPYWFMEALLQCTLIVVALFALPAIRRTAREAPLVLGLGLLGLFVALKLVAFTLFDLTDLANRTPDALLYLVAFGWCLRCARTIPEKGLMTALGGGFAALTLGLAPEHWFTFRGGSNVSHATWLAATTVALLWTPRIWVPQIAKSAISTIAAASFYIYMTHGLPVHYFRWMRPQGHLGMSLLASVALGIFVWWLVQGVQHTRLGRRSPAHGEAEF